MASMTIAQALASKLTGIAVVDTPANIAAAASNSALVARVSTFGLSASSTSTVLQASQIATLGAKFSRGSYTYTIRDTVAALTGMSPTTAAIANATAVVDTAANLLAAATSSVVLHATSTLMSVSASLSLANLITLEALPAFSVLAGQTITLADSAANLLALTTSQNRPSIKAFQVNANSAVTLANAQVLLALPGFSVAGNATLSVSGSVAAMTTASAIAAIAKIAAIAGTSLNVSDALSSLLSAIAPLTSLVQSTAKLTITETDSATGNVSQIAPLAAFGGRFSVLTAHTLTLADTAANLLAASPTVTSFAQATQLSQSASVSASGLANLTALAAFSAGSGHQLTVTDTLAALNALSGGQRATATAVIVQDTVAHLASAASLPSGTSSVVAQFDGTHYTATQAVHVGAFATGGITLSLVATTLATSMTIADTLQVLANDAAQINALALHGPLTLLPTDSNATLNVQSLLALQSLTGITLSSYGVAVSDTGAAITANAALLFGHGLASITIQSGVFSGTAAQLLDPTLHFAGESGPFSLAFASAFTLGLADSASAQLASNAVVSTAQLTALSLLPGFSVAGGVTLLVQDTIADLVSAAAVVASYATAIAVTDATTATVTAVAATTLANLGSLVGTNNFAISGHPVTVSDSAAALTNVANAAGVALATSLTLASSSVVNATQAIQLAAFGAKFSLAGNALTVIDSASALTTLAHTSGAPAAINAWAGQVLLSANVVQSVAATQVLQVFTGFSVGSHQLTISDTAANLLANAATVALAAVVELSQSDTVTVAGAVTLAAMHSFSTNSMALKIADTPAHLAAMSSTVAALATSEGFVTRIVGNAADYTISATQLASLQALSSLSMSGFGGSYTVSDTADALAALAPSLTDISFGSLLSLAGFALSADATVTASEATNLASFPSFSVAGHALNIRDIPSALLSQNVPAGIALATSVGISAPATVSAATAALLAALYHFGTDSNPLTILDTPAHLAAASGPALAVAAGVQVAPPSNSTIGDYTITAAQFATMAGLSNLSFAGFSGTITVLDSADNLYGLATSFAGAAIGSALLLARATMTSALSANAIVSAAELNGLASLPMLALNGHTLTLTDAPSTLLASFATSVPLATVVVLASHSGAWVVSASDATHLAGMPGFSVGTAGMEVLDSASALLSAANANGIAHATSVALSGDATITATNATYLNGLENFSDGTAHLTILDGAGKLAVLSTDAADLASSILLQGSGLVSVSQFVALRALPNFSTNGNRLLVADTAANLLTLSDTSTSLATMLLLDTAASLTAAQAETLVTLPNFTGTAQLTVSDTATHLLLITGNGTQPDDWAGELAATSVTLSANATLTAGQADELALLGSRFASGSFTLTVADTAANLLASANAGGLALATAVTLSGNETALSAAAATALAAMTTFSKGANSLTVSDTAANLLSLANAAGVALADHVQLSTATALPVANAESLIGLANFQVNAGATLTIADTLANLLSLTGASLAHNGSVLLATAIGLSMNTTATVAQMTALASVPEYASFSRNGHFLVVQDSGTAIAGYTHDAIAVPTSYVMTGDATLTAAQAATLAGLTGFSHSGGAIAVNDTVANLNAGNNAAWVNVDTSYGVTDTAGNLAAAASTALLTAASSVALSADADIDTTTVGELAGLASHFSKNGHVLTVHGTAAAVVAHAAALAALNVSAAVTDTTADVVASLTGLIMLGDRLTLVTLTDSTPLTVAQVDGLHYLTSVLAGNALTVTDTAVAVSGGLASLSALGVHLGTVNVSDTAANVDAAVSGGSAIQTLGALLHVTLTDVSPILAATTAGLVPVVSYLVGDTSIRVTDTGANIAGQSTFLAALGRELGTVALSDGTTVNAAVATGLAAIDSHLGAVTLEVVDTAAALVGASTALGTLRTDGHIGSIVAENETAAHVVTYANGLAALGATATIFDSSAHVLAALDGLELLSAGDGVLTAIALTDSPVVLTMTVNTLTADSAALAMITTSYGITVSDTAAHIQADLASGSSAIVVHLAYVSSIVASDSGGISLTQTQALTAGVADSFSSAMGRFSGGAFTVTGVDAAHVNAVAGLAVVPASMAVSDTAADIQADLVSGSSALVAHRSLISGIAVSDSGTITLTDTQARTSHVDDGVGSVFSLISGGSLVVTGVTVAHIDAIVALGVPPLSFAISDTAADIQADLALGGSSHILAHPGLISAIAVNDSGTITLTENQVRATGVDDGGGSALSKLSGGTLAVSAVLAADVGIVAVLPAPPASIAVSDTAAHIQADLVAGSSAILAHLGLVSGIAINDAGTISLTMAQVTASGVDNSAGAALTKLSGGGFVVTGAAVSDLATILGLAAQPNGVTVSDTAAHIRTDVLSGSSALIANHALVTAVEINDAGTISLTEAQITASGVDDSAGSVFGKTTGGTLAVTGATVANFIALDALTRHPDSVAVSDSAAHIQADLIAGSPVLVAHLSELTSVAITDGGTTTLTLTVAQLAADTAVLALLGTPFNITIDDTAAHVQSDLTGGSSSLLAHLASLTSNLTLSDGSISTITLNVAQLAADAAVLSRISSTYNLAISDTAAHVQSDLAAGASSTLLTNIALATSVVLTGGTTITLTEAQATYGGVATAMHKIGDLTSFVVTGATVAQITTVLGLGVTGTSVTIVDSATDVQSDLNGGSSVLLAHTAAIVSITLSDASPPTLSLTVAALAADAAVLARIGSTYYIAVSDTAADVQADLTGGSSTLVAHAGSLGSITLTDVGTQTIALTVATIQASQSVLSLIVSSFRVSISDSAADVQGDLTGGSSALLALASQLSTIALTDSSPPTLTLNVAQLAADASVLALIGSDYFVAVSDTAAHVQSDLAEGASSTILANLGRLNGVTLPGSSTITLTEAQAVHAGVATVLRETTGLTSFVVTGATVAQITAILALSVSNTTIDVSDTAADVQTDLTGGSSALLGHTAAIGAITLSDGLTPTLTLAVSDLVAGGTVLGLIGSTYHLVVGDTAAHVQADLAAGASSNLLAHIAALTGITLPDSSTITLTEAQATYGGVATVLEEASGLTGFVVTGATVAQIATVLALGVTGTSLTISDTAAHVQSDLTGGSSALVAHVSAITGITLTDSPATLTLSIAQLAADASVLTLVGSSYHIVVSDTAANVQSDLAAGVASTILAHSSALTGITLPGGSTITLTATQAIYTGVGAALAEATGLTSFVVSSTTVAQLPTVYALGITGTQIAIRDTAANLLSDMTTSGNLLADLAAISTITSTNGSQTYTVTIAQLSGQKTVFAKISPGYLVAVNDTATNVQNDLALGATSAIVVAHTYQLLYPGYG